jgi:mono/diheme cytochrome c family protein
MRACVVAIVVSVVMSGGVSGKVHAAQAPDRAKVAAGLRVYETQKCSTCHAIKGQGGKLSTALDGVGAKVSAVDLRKWFTNTTEMEAALPKKPAMTMSSYLKTHKLTDGDIDAVVAYMESLK